MKFLFHILLILIAVLGSSHGNKQSDDDDYMYDIEKSLLRILQENNEIKETVPMTNEELLNLMNEFPIVENDTICLKSEICAKIWMNRYNFLLGKLAESGAYLEYQYSTDINEENEKLITEFAPISNRFVEITKNSAIKFLENCDLWDASLRRMLYLASLGIVFKDTGDVTKLADLSTKLESIYATAKVCQNDKCLSLDPDITAIMAKSRDYTELLNVWKGWHDATGPKMRKLFAETVVLNNKGAVENGYADLSQVWMDEFEDENFEKNYDDLFKQIKPLYDELHKYVRNKLEKVYGANYPPNHDKKLLPAHLLGNMWAQTWENIEDLVIPYPNESKINLTNILNNKQYTPLKMFQEAENFFVSINQFKMSPTFWKKSMIEKPPNKDVVCHASATDLSNGFDFRIKMCTSINEEDFYTIHHEMGHIEYYMAYSKQPAIFRNGANSAFHEAIGDTISLSVMSNKHLKKIGLIESDAMTTEQDINYLMDIALKKLAFLPFGYLMDKWRWDVFRGKINETNYNQKWWKMRKDYQGLEAPVPRTENDFDPGAKYHIASYTPYARYFISHFLQFQFYESLCKLSNHKGPLHRCDFYQSKNAGNQLKKMLELGSSKHWSYALNLLTKQKSVNANSLFEYFKPLTEWLLKENLKK